MRLTTPWRFALPLLLMLLFAACAGDPCGHNADVFMARSERFFNEVKEVDFDASDPRWEEYDQYFTQLVEECYPQHEASLTSEQQGQFGTSAAQYYVQRYGKAGARGLIRKLKGGLDKLEQQLQ